MVDPATRPADQQPVLRADLPIPEQGGDAAQRAEPQPGDLITPEEEIRGPARAGVPDLKDDYPSTTWKTP